MKLLWMHALLGMYAVILGSCAWFEHEPWMVGIGILPVLLFVGVRSLEQWFEKREWSWTTVNLDQPARHDIARD